MSMERLQHPVSRADILLNVTKGHFATGHSHINYYIDVTAQKFCLSEARKVAIALAREYRASTLIDTILCLDGTEVIAACMASEMTKTGYMNINQNQDMNVLTPERSVGSQLIFRENTAPMINGKNVLIRHRDHRLLRRAGRWHRQHIRHRGNHRHAAGDEPVQPEGPSGLHHHRRRCLPPVQGRTASGRHCKQLWVFQAVIQAVAYAA